MPFPAHVHMRSGVALALTAPQADAQCRFRVPSATAGRPATGRVMTLHGLQVPPLPHPLTSLVGREHDVRGRHGVVDAGWCATHHAYRSCGRRQVAGCPRGRPRDRSFFSDRVFLIDFASVGDSTLLAPTIAVAVGLPPPTDGSSLIRLKLLIGEQRALIVVDNVDRVAASASPLTELLGACPQLAMLVTSRSRLRLHGEVVRQILPLPVPQSGDGITVRDRRRRSRHPDSLSSGAGRSITDLVLSAENVTMSQTSCAVLMASHWRSSWRRRGSICFRQPRY